MSTVVSVGWVLASDVWDRELLRAYEEARDLLLDVLRDQFPEFTWEVPLVEHRVYVPLGALDPLPLLELGAEEKIYRHWDYAIVIVSNELNPRHRIFTIGIPSSALEVAVVSTARLGRGEKLPERLAALILHMLGHLWWLDHSEEGPMRPPDIPEELRLALFPPEQQEELRERLRDIADARLEEQARQWGKAFFYLRTFLLDPGSIWADIWSYAPWRMPIYLGRLTAAAAVSTVFLLMTAEAWEIGAHLPLGWVSVAALVAIVGASGVIFFGQNMGQITREIGLREQAARTHLVLFGTLLLGMASLWVFIYVLSLAVASVLPHSVFAAWAGLSPERLSIGRYAAFMATVGVIASALGGNLEEEEDIKSEILFDEET